MILNPCLKPTNNTPRILAATLYGSYARGAADAWSDLDIGVIIADDAYDDFTAGRKAFVRLLGQLAADEGSNEITTL